MRQIIMQNRVSMDGYFASLNEASFGMDWFVQDPEIDIAVREGKEHVNTALFGGTTYRGFERSWLPILHDPNAPVEMKAVAEELTNMKKIVFSTTLRETSWANTTVLNGNLIEEVRKLKEENDSDMMIFGSGSIVQQLANHGLIDEYVFIVTPIVAGEGKPLFQAVQQFTLTLIEARPFESGNVLLRYKKQN